MKGISKMAKSPYFWMEIWTEHFLGTTQKCDSFLDILETMDCGRWIPERWNDYEPVRKAYVPESRDAVRSVWTVERPVGSGRVAQTIFFVKKKPRLEATVYAWRANVPSLNYLWLEIDAKSFCTVEGTERLRGIMLDLVMWSDAAYGTILHSAQDLRRVAQGTPLDRLRQLDGLTFFGPPYLALFGSERILNTPCYSVEEAANGVLLQAAEKPDSPEITDSDQFLISLEEYLGADAFAGRGFPEVPCRVPEFDLSETKIPN